MSTEGTKWWICAGGSRVLGEPCVKVQPMGSGCIEVMVSNGRSGQAVDLTVEEARELAAWIIVSILPEPSA